MHMRSIGYWTSTALLAAGMSFGAISDLTEAPAVMDGLHRLGYPPYLANLLGTWKLLGVLAITAPRLARLKEWAYAGAVFDLSGAAISHMASGDPAQSIVLPLVFLGVAAASWALRPQSRKLAASPAPARDRATAQRDPHRPRLSESLSSLMLLAAWPDAGSTHEPLSSPNAKDERPSATDASERTPAAEARAVVAFWRDAGPGLWFAKDPGFDRRFRERFLALHESAARGELDGWMATSEGALALLLLLDQFPRNAFRGTPRMYATDPLARVLAERALRAGHDRQIDEALRVFMYLPFGHSEELRDQQRSVELAQALGEPHLSHAQGHCEIVRRFGRFPHRNPILGRAMKEEEQSFLERGGFAG